MTTITALIGIIGALAGTLAVFIGHALTPDANSKVINVAFEQIRNNKQEIAVIKAEFNFIKDKLCKIERILENGSKQ